MSSWLPSVIRFQIYLSFFLLISFNVPRAYFHMALQKLDPSGLTGPVVIHKRYRVQNEPRNTWPHLDFNMVRHFIVLLSSRLNLIFYQY